MQQEQDKTSLQKEMTDLRNKLEMHFEQSSQIHTRPDPEDITRKNLLTPNARKLYNKTVQLKRDKRYLKRLIRRMKKPNISNKVTLRTTNYKGKMDNTAPSTICKHGFEE